MPFLDPDKLKIGYVILIPTHKFVIEKLQRKSGYGDSSRWTHVAGSLGGYTAIEANIPQSRLINLQKEYIDRGCEIKVMKCRNQKVGIQL